MQTEYGYFEEQQLGKPYDARLLRRVLPFAQPYLRLFAVSVALVIVLTLLDLALPLVTRQAIDRYIAPRMSTASRGDALSFSLEDEQVRAVVQQHPALFTIQGQSARIARADFRQLPSPAGAALRHGELAGLARLTVFFLALVALMFLVNFIQAQVMEFIGQRIMHDLRLALFEHMQGLALCFYTRNPVGRLVTRVTNDIANLNELFTSVVSFFFKDLFLLLGIAGVLLAIDWKLALISFAVLPLVIVVSSRFSSRSREAYRTLQLKIAEINTRFAETIGGMRVIQLFGQERHNEQRFRELNHEYYQAGMTQVHVLALFLPAVEVLAAVALAVVIYAGGGGVVEQTVSLGSLVAFISYVRMFFRPIRDIAEKYNILQGAMASAERIVLILDSQERLPLPLVATLPASSAAFRELRFEAVDFSYLPGEAVLKQVSFSLRRGQTVALVGPTGSGKTTVIALALRGYDPQAGQVTFNGLDLRQIDPRQLHHSIALVSQDPFLFSASLRENITLGQPNFAAAALERVIEAAQCRELVQRLPQGLDTPLAEAGKTLSSGERQLISIARALIREPELIILDEATSYIDSQTEARIAQALERLTAQRSALVVAHRLSTARRADRILVLHHGRIIEQGSHEELMGQGGFYRRLVELQG